MRVAILGSRGIPAVYGGFEVFAENLAEGLAQRGCEVTVYCPRSQAYREPSYKGARLRFLPHPPGGPGTLVFDVLSLLDSRRRDFDAVLMLGYGAGPFLALGRPGGRPLVVNTDGLEWSRDKWSAPARAWLAFAERSAVRAASALVSDNRQIRDYFDRTYGVASDFIPYGAPLPGDAPADRLRAFGVSPQAYYLAVMRMEPENSLEEIVRGFEQSGSERPLLMVGGSTPFFRERILPRLKAERIRYLGPLALGTEEGRAQLFQLRRHAFAYVHGHTAGGTSPSLLQAMGMGTPVVARDNPSTREVAGDSALYFGGAPELREAVGVLEAAPPEGRRERGAALRRRIEEQYTWDSVVDRYHELFKRLAR